MTAAGLQGIGWLSIRVRDVDRATRFHRSLGFDELTKGPTYTQFRAGPSALFNIGTLSEGAEPHPAVESHLQVRLCPIFRVYQIDQFIAMAGAAGAGLQEEVEAAGIKTFYLTDPENNIIGYREAAGDDADEMESQLRADWEAEHGDRPAIQGVGWIVVRVPDLLAAREFFDGLGFRTFQHTETLVRLDAGDDALLELVSEVEPVPDTPPLTDRNAAIKCPIFRVYDLDSFAERAKTANAGMLQRIDVEGGRILYFTDPHGNLMGFQERGLESSRPEDAILRTRWEQTGH